MRNLALIMTASLLVGGGAATAKSGRNVVPEAKPIGAPVNCINLQSIRESRVRSDKIIDFRATGNKWYRNELPNSCPSLKFEERFSYETSLNQLCNVDIINVLQSYGGHLQRGPSCGLGKFQPVELAKK